MYLSDEQIISLGDLLTTFFALPYSTDLDGKDAETLIRIAKNAPLTPSKRKELFDIVDGKTGYSVKTLRKSVRALRVDLQEQRFCDVDEMRKIALTEGGSQEHQGKVLLNYMRNRIVGQMQARGIEVATSIILLKDWNTARDTFSFRYWEEDFLEYIENLCRRNDAGEIEWLFARAARAGILGTLGPWDTA